MLVAVNNRPQTYKQEGDMTMKVILSEKDNVMFVCLHKQTREQLPLQYESKAMDLDKRVWNIIPWHCTAKTINLYI